MLVHKRIPLRMILRVEGKSISLFFALAIGIYAIHQFTNLPIELPVAMAATLGTGVSVLLGFKNNAAYERWWQARQNWGAIVNHSRILGIQLLTYTDWNQNLPDRERQKLLTNFFKGTLRTSIPCDCNYVTCQTDPLQTNGWMHWNGTVWRGRKTGPLRF